MRQGQRLEHSSLGVIALVGDHGFGRCLSQEHVGPFEAVRLPWREMKSGGPVHPPPRESWRSARRGCVRWLAAPPFCPSTALVRSHDGRADHCVLVAGLLRQGFENPLPYTAVAPATVGAGAPPGSLRNRRATRIFWSWPFFWVLARRLQARHLMIDDKP